MKENQEPVSYDKTLTLEDKIELGMTVWCFSLGEGIVVSHSTDKLHLTVKCPDVDYAFNWVADKKCYYKMYHIGQQDYALRIESPKIDESGIVNPEFEPSFIDFLEVGSKVYDILLGWGKVVRLNVGNIENAIVAIFPDSLDGNEEFGYYENGYEDDCDANPRLFLEEVTLTQKFPEFKKGELVWCRSFADRYWLCCYYSHQKNGFYYATQNKDLSDCSEFTECVKFEPRPF